MRDNEFEAKQFKVLEVAYSAKYMKKYFQHFPIFHMHQKIWYLSEKDATISSSTDSPNERFVKSYFSNSRVENRYSTKMSELSNK